MNCHSYVNDFQGRGGFSYGPGVTMGQGVYPFNWAEFAQLADSAPVGTYEYTPHFKVCVFDQGGTYDTTMSTTSSHVNYDKNRCCNWKNNCQPDDHGKTLVIFKGAGTVRIDGVGGQSWGPTILAPYAHILVNGRNSGNMAAQFIDGTLIAKSMNFYGTDGGNNQLHGRG